MCSVYELYESVVSGSITDAMDISRSWVYMASWSQEFARAGQADPGAGLAENCGGYLSANPSFGWFGTAVQWTTADTGKKALKFFTGPDPIGVPGTTSTVANSTKADCAVALPIACCN